MPETIYAIQPYSRSDRTKWDSFVQASKNGTFLFMRDYMDYHADRFTDASTIATDAAGRIVAVFPANQVQQCLHSHGGLTYGGMVSGLSMTTARALDVFAAWLEYCPTSGVNEIIYKAVPPIYHRAPAGEDQYAIFRYGGEMYRRDVLSVVDLQSVVPVQERRRRGAKKATSHGFEIRFSCDSCDLDAFWPILEDNLARQHGLRPVHSAAEMRVLRDRFPDNIKLLAAFDGTRMCAGTILYYAIPAIHAQYIASTADAAELGALDLMFTSLMGQIRSCARYFDFGNSNEQEGCYLNRGLSDFKEGFGARAICQDFYRFRLSASQSKWLDIERMV